MKCDKSPIDNDSFISPVKVIQDGVIRLYGIIRESLLWVTMGVLLAAFAGFLMTPESNDEYSATYSVVAAKVRDFQKLDIKEAEFSLSASGLLEDFARFVDAQNIKKECYLTFPDQVKLKKEIGSELSLGEVLDRMDKKTQSKWMKGGNIFKYGIVMNDKKLAEDYLKHCIDVAKRNFYQNIIEHREYKIRKRIKLAKQQLEIIQRRIQVSLEDRLINRKYAFEVANELGWEQPQAIELYESEPLIIESMASDERSEKFYKPLYYLGSKALAAEIKVLTEMSKHELKVHAFRKAKIDFDVLNKQMLGKIKEFNPAGKVANLIMTDEVPIIVKLDSNTSSRKRIYLLGALGGVLGFLFVLNKKLSKKWKLKTQAT